MRSLSVLFVFLLACSDSSVDPATDAGRRDAAPDEDAPPITCLPLRDGDGAPEVIEGGLEIGEYRDGAFVPYAPNDTATVVFGFQGGVMITPVVRFSDELAASGDCVEVEVRHLEDPAHPGQLADLTSFASYVERTYVANVAGQPQVETSALQDQVGWAPFYARFVLDVTVRSNTFARHVAIPLQLGSENACDDLVETPCPGCCYRAYPGEAVIEAVGDVGTGCDDTTTVTYRFEPSSEVASCFATETPPTFPDATELTMSRGCLDTYAIAAGSRFDTTWRMIASGTCSPLSVEPALPLVGCPCE
jgi:hypothetical protein